MKKMLKSSSRLGNQYQQLVWANRCVAYMGVRVDDHIYGDTDDLIGVQVFNMLRFEKLINQVYCWLDD